MATVLNNRYIRRARSSLPACNHAPLSSHGNKPFPATWCRLSLADSTYPRTARSSATSCTSRCSSLRNAGSAFRMSGRWHHTSLQLSEKTYLENLHGIRRLPIWFFTADFLIVLIAAFKNIPDWEMVNMKRRATKWRKIPKLRVMKTYQTAWKYKICYYS